MTTYRPIRLAYHIVILGLRHTFRLANTRNARPLFPYATEFTSTRLFHPNLQAMKTIHENKIKNPKQRYRNRFYKKDMAKI